MKDLTVGNEGKQIITFAMPMLIGSLFQQMYNTADSIIVGRFIGKEAMAAVSGANPIMFLLTSLLMGVTMGFSILISQYYGAKDMEKVKQSIDTTYLFVIIMSLVITILGIITSGPILRLIQTPEEIIQAAKGYLMIIFGGIIFSAGYNTISSILRGLGDSVNPLIFLIIATVINIILDIVFVVVGKMGVNGVALATIIAQAIAFLFSVIYLNKRHEFLKIKLNKLSYDHTIFMQGLKLGIPGGIQQMSFSIGNIALQSLINSYGTAAMAAVGAGGKIETFISIPIMNIGAAVSTFVAQNMGAGEIERTKRGVRISVKIALGLSITVAALLVGFSEPLIRLFNHDPEVVKIGSRYLQIIGPCFFMISTSFMLSSAIKGAGDAIFALFSSLISLWVVRIPAAYIFAHFMGVDGIWLGVPAGWIVGGIITFIYYKKGRWLEKIKL